MLSLVTPAERLLLQVRQLQINICLGRCRSVTFQSQKHRQNQQKKTNVIKQVRTSDRDKIHIISKAEGEMVLQMGE